MKPVGDERRVVGRGEGDEQQDAEQAGGGRGSPDGQLAAAACWLHFWKVRGLEQDGEELVVPFLYVLS